MRAEAVRLYVEEKMSFRKAGERVGLSGDRVRQLVINAGLQPRSHAESRQRDADEVSRVIKAYEDGASVPRLVKKYGAWVYEALRRSGKMRSRSEAGSLRRGFTKEIIRKAVGLYLAGESSGKVARRFNAHPSVVLIWVKRSGQSTRQIWESRKDKVDPKGVAKAKKLRSKGLTYEEIGKIIGRSQATAYEWASR